MTSFIVRALALAGLSLAASAVSCAGGEDDASGSGGGEPDASADGSDGAAGNAGGGAAGEAGSAGSAGLGGDAGSGGDAATDDGGSDAAQDANTNCGNGQVDKGETCDGKDFAGKTCASLGLGQGSLVCNGFCSIVASQCVPLEVCGDGKDNDKDGAHDCDDSECQAATACADPCAAPIVAVLGDNFGDTLGKPSVHAGSCAAVSDSESVYEFTAPTTGTLKLSANTGEPISVYVRKQCGVATSEVACGVTPAAFEPLELGVPVTQGDKLYIFVDETAASSFNNWYTLTLSIPPPESGKECENFQDDDLDGRLDCDDPTSCQQASQCSPGAGTPGSACTLHGQCAANGNDPVCLPDPAFPGGYCSEFCSSAQPCATGSLCFDLGISENGVCLDACNTAADCRVGYDCVDKGLGQKVCYLPAEWKCGDFVDNDGDQLIDCEDANQCQSLPACLSGPNPIGTTCSLANECQSPQKDPICLLSQSGVSFPDGYCSEFCDPTSNDCPSGTYCSKFMALASGNGVCLDQCTTGAECRPGYFCQPTGSGVSACVPPGVNP